MKTIEEIRKEIEKTKVILTESLENYEKNPDDYSAKLLLLSTENYLGDLLRQLDIKESKTIQK